MIVEVIRHIVTVEDSDNIDSYANKVGKVVQGRELELATCWSMYIGELVLPSSWCW